MRGQYQCRACGYDAEWRGAAWRRTRNWRPWPEEPPDHLPRKLWRHRQGQMLCGECRDPRRCKIAEPPEDAESKVALQAAKLRERSLQLGNERKKLKRSIKRPEPQESAGLEVPTAVGEEEPSPKELTVRPSHYQVHCLCDCHLLRAAVGQGAARAGEVPRRQCEAQEDGQWRQGPRGAAARLDHQGPLTPRPHPLRVHLLRRHEFEQGQARRLALGYALNCLCPASELAVVMCTCTR